MADVNNSVRNRKGIPEVFTTLLADRPATASEGSTWIEKGGSGVSTFESGAWVDKGGSGVSTPPTFTDNSFSI